MSEDVDTEDSPVSDAVEDSSVEDGATTTGGPVMVILITMIMGLIVWLRHRRRQGPTASIAR